jgi:Phage tail tube protein
MALKRYGIVDIRLSGQLLKYKGGVKLKKGRRELTPIIGNTSNPIQGYSEKKMPQGVELDITDDNSLDIRAIEDSNDLTMQIYFPGANETWILTNGALLNQWETEADEAKTSLSFSGNLTLTQS